MRTEELTPWVPPQIATVALTHALHTKNSTYFFHSESIGVTMGLILRKITKRKTVEAVGDRDPDDDDGADGIETGVNGFCAPPVRLSLSISRSITPLCLRCSCECTCSLDGVEVVNARIRVTPLAHPKRYPASRQRYRPTCTFSKTLD